jgi:hypothetical protein
MINTQANIAVSSSHIASKISIAACPGPKAPKAHKTGYEL